MHIPREAIQKFKYMYGGMGWVRDNLGSGIMTTTNFSFSPILKSLSKRKQGKNAFLQGKPSIPPLTYLKTKSFAKLLF